MDPNKYSELGYEAAIAELESIIRQLENGQVGLEESLKLYENGTVLAKHCEEKLAAAEKQIMVLTQSASGETVEKDFTAEDEGEQVIS
ncbi:MAG: exodeoxyribonuclease VII small subunit [Oscillospiraceae bacterium]|jgi:exodeoxyribonuclease VII small subunit|nr:exodeoxyribonuclease VII small subunit [Oscillospiraceae bacterium]